MKGKKKKHSHKKERWQVDERPKNKRFKSFKSPGQK